MGQLVEALCSHESQFFEWLPFDKGIEPEVPPPDDHAGRKEFIVKHWMVPRKVQDALRFRGRLAEVYGQESAGRVCYAEAYELSEYGYRPAPEELVWLFPFLPPGAF